MTRNEFAALDAENASSKVRENPVSDQRTAHSKRNPHPKVDDGAVYTDRHAKECHQTSAFGMW
jgi:hypothetical protein